MLLAPWARSLLGIHLLCGVVLMLSLEKTNGRVIARAEQERYAPSTHVRGIKGNFF